MDRFFRGLLAGLTGGVAMNIWSMTSFHLLHFTTRRFLDWSAIILYGHLPRNWLEAIHALILQLLWVGLLGVVFAFLIREFLTSEGLLIKGVFFGIVSGFIIYSIPVMLGVQYLEFTPYKTVLSSHIGGIIWGLVMAYTLGLLDRKYKPIK